MLIRSGLCAEPAGFAMPSFAHGAQPSGPDVSTGLWCRTHERWGLDFPDGP